MSNPHFLETNDLCQYIYYELLTASCVCVYVQIPSSRDADCLFDSHVSRNEHVTLPGQMISPEQQCRDVFGPQSGLCDVSRRHHTVNAFVAGILPTRTYKIHFIHYI